MGEINPLFQELLAKHADKCPTCTAIPVIVQAELEMLNSLLSNLASFGKVNTSKIVATSSSAYIPLVVDDTQIAKIAALPGVKKVSYDAPITIRDLRSLVAPGYVPYINDPLMGRFGISAVTIPGSPVPNVLAAAPLAPLLPITQLHQPGYDIIPSSKIKEFLGIPKGLEVKDTKVAILDTGSPQPLHPQVIGKSIDARDVTGEGPFDMMGHGSFCANIAFGKPFPTRFGEVDGMVNAKNIRTVKCLSTAGFGATSWILQAMKLALDYGAKVISMSLGGELQGSVADDPLVQFIEETSDRTIWCVAAGNEGPGEYTVGSPGAAPSAITVAAGAWPETDKVAVYSSRGPQGSWYKDKQGEFDRDYAVYGENFVKPDIYAPGGGRPTDEDKPDTILLSGLNGWFDGYYSLTPGYQFEAMKGTSMATPIVAGMVALLVESGVVKTAEDVKRLARNNMQLDGKSYEMGYGLMHMGWQS